VTGHADQDGFYVMEFFPQWMRDTLTAAVRAGEVTTAEATAGGLLFYDRVLAAPAGSGRRRAGSLDFAVLVPDPAGRPGALAAYRSLLFKLPGDDLARFTAVSMRAVPSGEAEAAVAGQYASGDAWILASGDPATLTASAMRLGGLPGCACWFDDGTGGIIACTGETAATLGVLVWTVPNLAGGLLSDPDQGPAGGVLAVPKDVSAGVLASALGKQIPDDSPADLILLTSPGWATAWPGFLVRAVARSDPGTAADMAAESAPGRRQRGRPSRKHAGRNSGPGRPHRPGQ
jgi:hypothetical protein